MAIPAPEKLDSINKNVTNKQRSANNYGSYIIDNFYNSLYKNKTASNFKALDFSNAAIYGAKDHKSADEEKFRHFHQMRLYIDSGVTYHHTNSFQGKTIICCNLPEQIQYSLNSKWEAPLQFGDATFNLLMQMAGKELPGGAAPSGTLRASTFRIWTNTEPLTLNLTIPVIDDGVNVSGTNLVEALEILGALALPAYNQGGKYGFYVPPPSPLDVNIKYTRMSLDKNNRDSDTFTMATQNHSRIMLQLGGVLLVDNCIIESVSVQYPNTKAQIKHKYNMENFGMTGHEYLHPLLAIVNLRISTVEALTADTYAKMLWARQQTSQGSLTTDLSDVTNLVNDIFDWTTAAPKDKEE